MSNKELNKLLAKADSQFERLYGSRESLILRGYKKALDDVKYEISKAFENASKFPSITELRKFNRLDKLEKEITRIVGEMQKTETNIINSGKKESIATSYANTQQAINTSFAETGLSFSTPILKESVAAVMTDNLWLDALKGHNAKLLTDTKIALETVLRTNAREEVVAGLIQGKPYSQVAKAIQARFNVTAGRAKVIAFTEMHKGHSTGRNDGIKSAMESAERLGFKSKKVWKHNGVGVARQQHLSMDGKAADKNGLFHIGGLSAQAPGLFGDPAQDANCHCSALFELEGINQGI